jgi:hypothetical protein
MLVINYDFIMHIDMVQLAEVVTLWFIDSYVMNRKIHIKVQPDKLKEYFPIHAR